MSELNIKNDSKIVQERLIKAAFELFLNNDYNKVTTRQLAKQANTSLSMIQYYFGDKQTLYNTMVREQFRSISQALEQAYSEENGLNFSQLMLSYLEIHKNNPDFPAFITKILAYKNGPGYMLFAEILDNKRELIQKLVKASQNTNHMSQQVDVDVLRIIMMSLTVFPFLIKDVLALSGNTSMEGNLMEKVALFSGALLDKHTRPDQGDIWQL